MSTLAGKHVVVAITGSIAAYKSCELIRLLKQSGASVRVILTQGGAEFITGLTLQALSGERVLTQLLDEESEAAMSHIELARWADLLVIAPASANSIACLAMGMADDLLSTVVLATLAPVVVVPAMNQAMWQHAAVQRNLQTLQTNSVQVWGPGCGEQACGDVGEGRMLEPDELFSLCQQQFEPKKLTGRCVLITAGPTQEAIDPVRYLSNRSSGKMGYALAEAAAEAGAKVFLISGPTQLPRLKNVCLQSVTTADQMHAAVMACIKKHTIDVFISAAAVSDYHILNINKNKIKKSGNALTLDLIKTKDILYDVAQLNHRPFLVGFSAETEKLEVYAKHKLDKKGIDMIVANEVGEDKVFGQDDNAVIVLTKQGQRHQFVKQRKTMLARHLIDLVDKQMSAILV